MNTCETTPAGPPARPEGYRAQQAFAAPPDVVFAALTSAAAISRWWAPCTGTGTAGGTLRLPMGDSPVVIEVETAEPARHVRWSVAVSEPLPEWAGTHIDFVLRAAAGGGTAFGSANDQRAAHFEESRSRG